MARILVLNGPNLNLLGTREPDVYGSDTLADIVNRLQQLAAARGAQLTALQSNAEHELIAAIQGAKASGTDAIILNAGAFTHTSVALRDALAAHPDVVPLLERAAACPGLDRQWDFNLTSQSFLTSMLTERVSSLRSIWRVLHYQAEVQLADGRRDDALRTCLAMLKLTRLLHHEPCIVNFLVGMAVRWESIRVTNRVLTSGPISPELHAELEAELARQDLAAAYRESLRSERALGSDCFRDLGVPYHFQPLFKNDHCDYLDLIAFAIATADRPLDDGHVRDEFARVSREAGMLTRLFAPAVDGARESRFRNETFLHALRVLNAIQAREQAGDASEPQLDKLGLPVEATLDPVNGEPLRLKKTPQGWLIYGVGANLTDDGGQLEDLLDVGVGPSEVAPQE